MTKNLPHTWVRAKFGLKGLGTDTGFSVEGLDFQGRAVDVIDICFCLWPGRPGDLSPVLVGA